MLVNVDPRNDYAFKVVFGSERHTRVLTCADWPKSYAMTYLTTDN